MNRGCPLHSKDLGSSPVAFPFFLLSFNLLVFILDFVYTWIYLFESGIRLFNKYTRRNMNNFNKPKCNNSTRWMILILLLSSADFFSKLTLFRPSFRNTIRVSYGLYPVYPDQD